MDKLNPCQFEPACQCIMDEPCEGCETKAEYDKRILDETVEACAAIVDLYAQAHGDETALALREIAALLRALKEDTV